MHLIVELRHILARVAVNIIIGANFRTPFSNYSLSHLRDIEKDSRQDNQQNFVGGKLYGMICLNFHTRAPVISITSCLTPDKAVVTVDLEFKRRQTNMLRPTVKVGDIRTKKLTHYSCWHIHCRFEQKIFHR